jgi:hypothetical protein
LRSTTTSSLTFIVELPVVGVPTATLVGWNLRRAPYAEGELCELNGRQACDDWGA